MTFQIKLHDCDIVDTTIFRTGMKRNWDGIMKWFDKRKYL
jgi:hypothetical protein